MSLNEAREDRGVYDPADLDRLQDVLEAAMQRVRAMGLAATDDRAQRETMASAIFAAVEEGELDTVLLVDIALAAATRPTDLWAQA